MAEKNDCPCPDSSPTPKRGDGGKALPTSDGQGTTQIQLMGEQSRNPDGSSVVRGVKIGPRGGMLVDTTTDGCFTGTHPTTGDVYFKGLLIALGNLT